MKTLAPRLVALLFCVGLAACQTAQPMTLTFSQSQAEFTRGSGTGSVIGQAFMRQNGGGVVTAAGSDVLILPDQAYTRELVNRDISGQGFFTADFAPVGPYVKKTIADAGGNFRFQNLAAGNYIVLTEVEWVVPTRYGGMNQGGTLASPVSVQDGQVSEVILR